VEGVRVRERERGKKKSQDRIGRRIKNKQETAIDE